MTQKSPQQVSQPESKTNGFAIAGIILAFLVPLVGLIFSIIGLKKAKDYDGDGRSLSIAGIVISIISLVLSLLVIFALVNATYDNIQKRAEKTRELTLKQAAMAENVELSDKYTEVPGFYSIKLPKGWETQPYKSATNIMAYPSEKSGDKITNAIVKVGEKSENETLADIAYNEFKPLRNPEAGGIIKSEKDIIVSGLDAREIITSLKVNGNVQEYYIVILAKTDSIYLLGYTTTPDRMDNYLPVFKASAQSFNIK